MKKLNTSIYKFTDFIFETTPKYFRNVNGRNVEAFIFKVKCEYGEIRFYIDIDINFK